MKLRHKMRCADIYTGTATAFAAPGWIARGSMNYLRYCDHTFYRAMHALGVKRRGIATAGCLSVRS